MSDPIADLIVLVQRAAAAGPPTITATTRFETLDGWTSLAALRLLTAVEEWFGVRLDLRTYFSASRLDELSSMITAAQYRTAVTNRSA